MAREMKDSGIEWIGEIPSSWGIASLKYLCKMQAGRTLSSEQIVQEGQYPVYGGNGIRGFYKDFNCEGKYLLIGRQGALCGNVHKVEGKFWATEHAVLVSISDKCDVNFMHYMLIGMNLNQYASNTAAQPGLAVNSILSAKTCMAPIDEQQKIAKLLDNICSELDNMLIKIRTSIEEYKKLKQAVITWAVTQGVRGKREMKDCKVEWIKKIPVDWKEQRIKTLFDLRDEKNYLPLEEVNLISLYTDLGVVQHSELEKTTGNKATKADGYKIVCENDIIVNIILCWMGAIGRSAYNGVTSPAYDIYIPRSGVESRFYHYYFRTRGFSGDCYKRGKGIMAMRWRTYSEQFRDISVVYPPLREQIEIVNYLDEKCAEIDNLIAKKEKYFAEIENYKKSLIYEYVTGKKEV